MGEVITIMAGFEAGPVREPLEFWMRALGIPALVEIPPCNPVLRLLLDPPSLAAKNSTGFNVLLLRWQDWVPRRKAGPLEAAGQNPAAAFGQVEAAVRELAGCLRDSLRHSDVYWMVCVCPSSPSANVDALHPGLAAQAEDLLAKELKPFSQVCLIGSRELAETYPVAAFNNPFTDEIAQIPYTPRFYAVLGTLIARKVWRLKNPPPKVVVLDCDQTLWRGVCSEDGPEGVILDAPRRELQEFMLNLRKTGVLLCLCSKNEERDVREVFERHQDWPLQFDHFAARRINWGRKSENIRSLAEELRLGLDSFIFVDDDPRECAEARLALPEVLCLTLPGEEERIPKFLAHVWAFDPFPWITEADKNRAAYYHQEAVREQSRRASPSFSDFLADLSLETTFESLTPAHFSRAAQLTQRTHQFNLAPKAQSAGEIARLIQADGWEGFGVQLRDRFGDYGMVGLLLFKARDKRMAVDTFLLSCRALGRNVEHRMIARLGEMARARGWEEIEFSFVATGRNHLALEFLPSLPGGQPAAANGSAFRFSTNALLAASLNGNHGRATGFPRGNGHGGAGKNSAGSAGDEVNPQPNRVRDVEMIARIALQYDSADAILQAIRGARRQRPRPLLMAAYQAPASEVETRLAAIWRELLGLDQIGRRDNFFDLGGDSFMLVQLEAEIHSAFSATVDLAAWAARPDLANLADLVETQMVLRLEAGEVESLFRQIEGVSESEALDWMAKAAGHPVPF